MRPTHPRIVLGLHRSRYERRILTAALDLGVNAIDTSFNYRGFTAHATLADIGSDLLPHYTVSTKVGYFLGQDGAEHSLDPKRLLSALEQTNRDLGRAPDLVFLHNPESSVQDDSDRARDALAQACAALADARAKGLCGSWGIASWSPSLLVNVLESTAPKPSVLMIRAGLLVGANILDAGESLATHWGLSRDALWGMSPFGGSARDPVWDRIDPRVFLRDGGGELSHTQAAFRVAYGLPQVDTLAVGTDDADHLRELIGALPGEIDEQAVHQYRGLLRDRLRGQPA
ncbi:aldo/keto reductase [Streptomyces sp. NPDC059373]